MVDDPLRRNEVKTQKQLVNLIAAHSFEAECFFCKIELGKRVEIPCDPRNGVITIHVCAPCYLSEIQKTKRGFIPRVKEIIGNLRKIGDKKPEGEE